MSSHRRSILFALAAVGCGLLFRLLFVTSFDFGPEDLETYEERSYGVDLPDRYGDVPFLLGWSRGDGQAYLTIAADPWAEAAAREMTPALYRYSRAGFAWLARLAALGFVELIPLGLLAVNVAALATLGWVAGSRWETSGSRSLLLIAVPGTFISFASDTAEALGLALAALVVVLPSRIGSRLAGAGLGMVRPDFALAVLPRGRRALPALLATAVAAIGIRLFGTTVLDLGWAGANGNFGVPLAGYLEVIPQQPSVARVITVLVLAVSVSTLARGVMERETWSRIGFASSGLLALSLSDKVLVDPMNSLRAIAFLSLLWAVAGPRSQASERPEASSPSELHAAPRPTRFSRLPSRK